MKTAKFIGSVISSMALAAAIIVFGLPILAALCAALWVSSAVLAVFLCPVLLICRAVRANMAGRKSTGSIFVS